MTRQRNRHLERQPVEEMLRLELVDYLQDVAEVEVERHAYDWRADDLLVWLRLRQPISGDTLSLFRRRIAEMIHGLLPATEPFGDWLVVIEYKGESLVTLSGKDKREEAENETGHR